MSNLIVDTSVFIKWLNQDKEQDLDKADEILENVKSGNIELIEPELIKYEIGNVLLKGKQVTPEQANNSFGTVHSLPITFVPDSEKLSRETYSLASELDISYYDASFLSLAKQYKATLVTSNPKDQAKASGIKVIQLKEYSSSEN